MAKLTLNDFANITGGETSAIAKLNSNNTALETALENTLSRDGTSPNEMNADFDMNGNDILNAGTVAVDVLTIGGEEVVASEVLSLPNGDRGDITVSGATWTIDSGVVTTTKLGGDITTAGKALLDDATAAAQLVTLGITKTAAEINALSGSVYFSRDEVEAATIPVTTETIFIADSGAIAESISTPSPVKPWHVLTDNGRYFEQRFPNGQINLWAFAGSTQGLDATDDTDLFHYAFDYANRAWWEGGGGALAWQRGHVFVPGGIWRINPTNPPIAFNGVKVIGAGDYQSMIRAHNSSAGSLFLRSDTATYNSSQRTTHVRFSGMRFILSGDDQHALNLAHTGRLDVDHCTFTTQDMDDERNNVYPHFTGTYGVRLRNSDVTLVGGDVVTIENNYFYQLDRGIMSGNGAGYPGPEKLTIRKNEISDCDNSIIVNDYGGAHTIIADNTLQRWAVGSRAIDIVGRFGIIKDNYLESSDNDRGPILLRSGSTNMVVHRFSHTNHTAHEAVAGPPLYRSLGTNDGTDCIDEYGTALTATFTGWQEY